MSYSTVKGFYLHNTSDYLTDWIKDEDGYIQFPDLVYDGFHGYTGYKFNPEFSVKALSLQTERQIKSAGSFIPLLYYNYYIIDNRVLLTSLNSSQKSNNLEMIISTSYFYTISFKKYFYFSAGIIPGAGFIRTRLLTRLPSGNDTGIHCYPIYRAEAQFALGYHSQRFFIGSQVVASWATYDQDKTSTIIINDRFTYQVFIGYRLNAPKVLKSLVDKVER